MEKFKAVEKAMKTKAYSKEGLSAAAKLDPKEQAKVEMSEFLSSMVDELEQQIETLEAESESIGATMKKGKSQAAKQNRIDQIDEFIERHKFHQGKLELIRRSLENGGVETEQVRDLEESIRYYVTDGTNDDFIEDDGLYDELDLEEEEGTYGMTQEGEKSSSQDGQSVQEEATPEPEAAKPRKPQKEPEVTTAVRKPSSQTKSPLPALATLHAPLTAANSAPGSSSMKPASVPTRPAGEGLKYASAAAAAAASDKGVGIAPLPPPPGFPAVGVPPLPPAQSKLASATSSPASTSVQPVPLQQAESKQAPSTASATAASSTPNTVSSEPEPLPTTSRGKKGKAPIKVPPSQEPAEASKGSFCIFPASHTSGSARIHTDISSSHFPDKRRRERHQAHRGGARGVHLPSPCKLERSHRIVRDQQKSPAAPGVRCGRPPAGRQPGERTRLVRRRLPAELPPRGALFWHCCELPQGAAGALRRSSLLRAH